MALTRAVAIAGSAGSIDTIKAILFGLPATFPAPIFVVVHVGARGLILASLLDKVGELPVKTAEDGDPPEPGHVYVAPADRHLLVIDGRCRLGNGPRENMSRPAIARPRQASSRIVPRSCGVMPRPSGGPP